MASALRRRFRTALIRDCFVINCAEEVLQYTDTGLMAAHEYTYSMAAVSTQGLVPGLQLGWGWNAWKGVLSSLSPAVGATTEPAGRRAKPPRSSALSFAFCLGFFRSAGEGQRFAHRGGQRARHHTRVGQLRGKRANGKGGERERER